MEYKLRKTKTEDIDQVIQIINQAIAYMKDNNINQWQDGYPNNAAIELDIYNKEGYVLVDSNDVVVATCMVTTNGEPSYKVIDGKWLNSDDYICIHRIAVDSNYKGKQLAKVLVSKILNLFPDYHNVKVDTHDDNLSMQRFLEKNKFTYCGHITLNDGTLRKAYQLIY
ncbi:MAG: GNAT family N-acetyltransferase [Thomasclavelia sp.]|nr:GNAT family N-acetyltransferase [Thomasclavelia sp.]